MTELNDFAIDENNVDGELCRAGRELAFYGSQSAEFKANVANKKLELEAFEAMVSLRCRANSTQRATEGLITATIAVDPEYQRLSQEVIKAELDYNRAENLFRTHQKRTDCIIALAYKQRTEISKTY